MAVDEDPLARPGWAAGRVRHGAEALDAEIEFWLAAPPSVRLAAAWQLVEEAWTIEGTRWTSTPI